jgi:hypothetical protein
MKTVAYTLTAMTALKRHANRAKLIRAKIEQYAANPAAQARNVKRWSEAIVCGCAFKTFASCLLRLPTPSPFTISAGAAGFTTKDKPTCP